MRLRSDGLFRLGRGGMRCSARRRLGRAARKAAPCFACHRTPNFACVRSLCLLGALVAAALARGEYAENVPFTSGAEGYNTYRIPAIVATTNGTLLAFCEGRKTSLSDAGDIDLVLKRSTDAGDTWGALTIVQEEGDTATITIGNPVPVVDRQTGRIWLAFCRNNSRVFVTWSDDDGQTWAERQEITADVKRAEWSWYATGPVHGIQLARGAHAGRLVVPCDHISTNNVWGSHVVYSDDHGASWHLGGVVDAQSGYLPNECVAVELADGSVYLNSRNHGGQKRRVYAVSSDGGQSFGAAALDDTLVEPVVQASALRYSAIEQGGETNLVLFSNPANTSTRTRMTVRRSTDEAASWDQGKLIYDGPSAYSDLVRLGDGRVGLLFEKGVSTAYETITFARFDLGYLDASESSNAVPTLLAAWTFDAGDVSGVSVSAGGGTATNTTGTLIADASASNGFLALDGTNDYLQFGNNLTGLRGLSSMTVCAWVKVGDGGTALRRMVEHEDNFYLWQEGGYYRFTVHGSSSAAISTNAPAAGVWQHVLATYQAGRPAKIYVNGVWNGDSSAEQVAMPNNAQTFQIGARRSSSGAPSNFFCGELDDVAVWDGVLSQTQIEPLAGKDLGGYEGRVRPTALGDSAFLPSDLPGLQLWLRADAGVYSDEGVTPATNGAIVVRWNDASGNARHASRINAVGNLTYARDSLNGRPVIRLTDASNGDYLRVTNSYQVADTDDLTVFVVSRAASQTVNGSAIHPLIGSGNPASGVGAFCISTMRPNAGGSGNLGYFGRNYNPFPYDEYTKTNETPNFSDGAGHVIELLLTGASAGGAGTFTGYYDGKARERHDGLTANPANGAVEIGGSYSGSDRRYAGAFGDILIYGRALTEKERNKVGWYLQTKYGLSGAYVDSERGTLFWVQ